MHTDDEQPLRRLRRQQIDQLLRNDPPVAALADVLREELAKHRLVIAKLPPMSESEKRDRLRRRRTKEGLCRYAPGHGKATHGAMCDDCYQYSLDHLRKRRAAAEGAVAA